MPDQGVGGSGGHEFQHEFVQRRRQADGPVAEVDEDVVFVACDPVRGQAVDAAGRLGVQQDEEAGDAVFGRDARVVQQPPGNLPAFVLIVGAGRSGPAGRRGLDSSGDVPPLRGPPDERGTSLRVHGLGVQIALHLCLRASAQGLAPIFQPGQEGVGRHEMRPDVQDLLMAGGLVWSDSIGVAHSASARAPPTATRARRSARGTFPALGPNITTLRGTRVHNSPRSKERVSVTPPMMKAQHGEDQPPPRTAVSRMRGNAGRVRLVS